MTPEDTDHAIAALSARQIGLESLFAAAIANDQLNRSAALANYDAAAQDIRDPLGGGSGRLFRNEAIGL